MAEWKPINDLFDFEKGTLQSSKCRAGEFTFVTAAEEWKTHESYTHDCEALIFAMAASGSLGRTHYINGKFIASDLCFILTPRKGLKLDMLFYYRLFNFLRSDIVKKTSTGTSKLAINQTNFGAYQLPYFDYEHQLMFRDKIERITEISQNFDTGLNNQLALLKKFRQAILQEAIEGKLTKDWREMNPDLITGQNHASKLLEKIKAEKDGLIKAGKFKKDKAVVAITDAEKPFDLPKGWVWCRLGEISLNIHYGFNASAVPDKKEMRLLRITDIQDNNVNWDTVPGCIYSQGDVKRYQLSENDIVIARTGGTIGKSFLIKSIPVRSLFASYLIRIIPSGNIVAEYLKKYLESPEYWRQLYGAAWGAGQPNVNGTALFNLLVALPPYAEHNAIVERLNKIMDMIDDLEKQVAERKGQSESLMRSVLSEAFAC